MWICASKLSCWSYCVLLFVVKCVSFIWRVSEPASWFNSGTANSTQWYHKFETLFYPPSSGYSLMNKSYPDSIFQEKSQFNFPYITSPISDTNRERERDGDMNCTSLSFRSVIRCKSSWLVFSRCLDARLKVGTNLLYFLFVTNELKGLIG